MFVLYFLLWVVLNGKWTLEIGAFGLVFAALAYAFSCKFLGYSPGLDAALLRHVVSALRYVATLIAEIVKANFAVMGMILRRNVEPEPQLVRFDVNLKRSRHLVALADSITLTPGTITVDLQDNHYLVHCLDKSLVDGLDNGAFVTMLEEMERRHPVLEGTSNQEKAVEAKASAPRKAKNKKGGRRK